MGLLSDWFRWMAPNAACLVSVAMSDGSRPAVQLATSLSTADLSSTGRARQHTSSTSRLACWSIGTRSRTQRSTIPTPMSSRTSGPSLSSPTTHSPVSSLDVGTAEQTGTNATTDRRSSDHVRMKWHSSSIRHFLLLSVASCCRRLSVCVGGLRTSADSMSRKIGCCWCCCCCCCCRAREVTAIRVPSRESWGSLGPSNTNTPALFAPLLSTGVFSAMSRSIVSERSAFSSAAAHGWAAVM
mmetsp:Transcript_1921/g.5295  ORF Transcript_1921/g.5295 Transcript_1921/m.5295 type:complete len:241 (+) Transcript_1921:1147-1869(+)